MQRVIWSLVEKLGIAGGRLAIISKRVGSLDWAIAAFPPFPSLASQWLETLALFGPQGNSKVRICSGQQPRELREMVSGGLYMLLDYAGTWSNQLGECHRSAFGGSCD